MSSPPAGSAGGSPGPNWYPDPSIPGYIRYWNGAAWMPGTSRPEPRDGEQLPAPPPGAPAPALPEPAPEARALPELEPARRAGDEDAQAAPVAPAQKPDPRIDPRGQFLRATPGREPQPQAQAQPEPQPRQQAQAEPERVPEQQRPAAAAPAALPAVPEQQARPVQPALPAQTRSVPPERPHEQTAQLRLPKGESWQHQVRELAQQAPQQQAPQPLPPLPVPQQQQQQHLPVAQPQPQQQQAAPQLQPASAQSPFLRSHQADPLTPLPFSKDAIFGAGDQLYPAGLGRRLLARLIDSLLPLGAAAAMAAMVIGDARDHIQQQIDAANEAGVTREIWLIDGTTGGYLAMVLGVFLVAGFLFEALPTALWSRSPGKALCKLRVLDLQSQVKPTFGAALSRWFLYSVLGILVIGIVNVLWGVRDRPWHQCWHDKAAGTFVAR